jgi:hypothetical protein
MRCLKYGSSAIKNPAQKLSVPSAAISHFRVVALRIAHSVSDAALESSIVARDSHGLHLTLTAQAQLRS